MSINDEHDPDEILIDPFDTPILDDFGYPDIEMEEKNQILFDLFDDEMG